MHVLIYRCFSLAGLLLKLQELISKVPIPKRDEGFTKPGPYIYEMLKSLNITHETAPKLIGTVEEAAVFLEEEKQRTATNAGSKLEIIADMLKLIFRENGSNHADVYRVSFKKSVVLYILCRIFIIKLKRKLSFSYTISFVLC